MISMPLDMDLYFDKIWNSNFCGISFVEKDGSFLKINPFFCRVLEYTDVELINLTFQDITHPKDVHIDVELANQVSSGSRDHYHMTKRYISKTGKIVWTNIYVVGIFDNKKKFKHYMALIYPLYDPIVNPYFERNFHQQKFENLIFSFISKNIKVLAPWIFALLTSLGLISTDVWRNFKNLL